jgi:hypothetical protein
LYIALPAVPTDAVSMLYTLYGETVESVIFGFVKPEKDAKLSDPHAFVEWITLTRFVAADPLVVHASCRSQLAVKVQAGVWASGPCSVNIPTLNLNFATSVPGSLPQHKL